MEIESVEVIRALGALAHDHRLAAFRLLVQAGTDGLAAGVIAEQLGMPASSMSFHLAALAHAGLITQRRKSRLVIYSAKFDTMNAVLGYLTANCCGGVPCTDASVCCPDGTADPDHTDAKDVT